MRASFTFELVEQYSSRDSSSFPPPPSCFLEVKTRRWARRKRAAEYALSWRKWMPQTVYLSIQETPKRWDQEEKGNLHEGN